MNEIPQIITDIAKAVYPVADRYASSSKTDVVTLTVNVTDGENGTNYKLMMVGGGLIQCRWTEDGKPASVTGLLGSVAVQSVIDCYTEELMDQVTELVINKLGLT